MSFGNEHRLPSDIGMALARKERARTEHLALPGLTAVLVAVAAFLLLVPVDFNETVVRPSGMERSLSLECGSVISPKAKVTDGGFSSYPGQCTAQRTQWAGYAGLALAGALVVMTVGAAVQRRKPSPAAP
ncbi:MULTISPECIES: hypothetical protein [unclassified Streptomyces]|uniref:hypothetical protein n=1 Tax=unclassified Streptomyces TaxID=2593676 RepID=UPI00332E7416